MSYVTKDCCPSGCKGIDIGDGNSSGCACKGDGAPCDCPNHKVETTEKPVLEDTQATDKAEREERVLSMDEARAQVCRSVADMLERSIDETEAELQKALAAGQAGPAEKTGARVVVAARELRAQLITTARKLDRPRILRPDRSIKVVR